MGDTLQYTKSDGTFYPCGETVRSIESGFYDVKRSMMGYGLRPRSTVSDELIDIPGTVADEVFADIDSFLRSRARFARFHLTHKRGYLFWGPPGTGKTSLGVMVGRRFTERVGGVVIYVGDSDDLIQATRIMGEVEPGRPSMYLIEEADEIVDSTQCLSILDGELSIQGAVFVAMTNYRNKLPPRISNRPGRFDQVILVSSPPAAVQVEYLRRIYARDPEGCRGSATPETIVQALEGITLSLAHLREAFISHVLMDTSLEQIRARFEDMSNVDPTDAPAAIEDNGSDEDYDSDGDEDCLTRLAKG